MQSPERRSGTVAIWVIITVNAAVYLLMCMEFGETIFSAKEAAMWGALYSPFVSEGESWRLLTANYIHFDLRHIFFNMTALLSWGGAVASHFGFVRFTVFYTLCGLAGSLASFVSHPNTVCAGASGAVSGVLGACVALYATGYRHLAVQNLWHAILFSAAYSLLAPSIDWQAHAGGFAAGIALGYGVLWTLPKAGLSENPRIDPQF